jgi:hypothetical protein
MPRIAIEIEHKPEDYTGPDVSITLKAKPSARYVAEYLRDLILADEAGEPRRRGERG